MGFKGAAFGWWPPIVQFNNCDLGTELLKVVEWLANKDLGVVECDWRDVHDKWLVHQNIKVMHSIRERLRG